MAETMKPVIGYVKGHRYHVTFATGEDGGATITQMDVLSEVYTPEGAGFKGAKGHTTERGLATVKALGTGRFAVVWSVSGEPISGTATNLEFGEACELAAKQAAVSVLRDLSAKGELPQA